MVDLSYPLESDAALTVVTPQTPGALELYRHSTAHLLAAAVTALFPEAQCGIGPPTDDGFFYDFIVHRPFVPEDLAAIEEKMRELAKRDLAYERKMLPKADAKAYFAGRGEPLKVQLIEEKGGDVVSCYTIEDAFIDFCTGPHVPSTGRLKAFKVLSSSNAYWKGDAANQPMQRIYGTAFFKRSALDEHLERIEEAKKRDHRKVGRELELFTFQPLGAGGRRSGCPRGALLYGLLSRVHAREAGRRRLPGGAHAAGVQPAALGDLRALGALPREHVHRGVGAGAVRAEGDELPRPHADLRQPGAQLPRAAAAHRRPGRAAPPGGVRRAVGADARAAVRAGRRPLLRGRGPDRRGGRAAAGAGGRRVQ